MPVIPAVFENGVFRPLGPVELPEGSRVQVEVPAPHAAAPRTPAAEAHIDRVNAILSKRFYGGEPDAAAGV